MRLPPAPYLEPLALFDRAHVGARVQQRIERAGVQPRGTSRKLLDRQPALVEIGTIHVGDLEFTAVRRLEPRRDLDHVVVVEVQAWNGVLGARCLRLLFQRHRATPLVELHHTVRSGICHPVGEDPPAVDGGEPAEARPQLGAVENVVPESQSHTVRTDEGAADLECLGDSFRLRMDGIVDVDTELRAVAEQRAERRGVYGSRDHQDVADAGKDQSRQRVVDHRFVVDG